MEIPQVEKYEGDGVILEIPIEGIIFRNTEEEFWGEKRMGAYERIIADLEKVEEDDDVKAILFRVNSPGGAVSACDRLYQIIKEFKKNLYPETINVKGVPVGYKFPPKFLIRMMYGDLDAEIDASTPDR